jgi:hypothetical protein
MGRGEIGGRLPKKKETTGVEPVTTRTAIVRSTTELDFHTEHRLNFHTRTIWLCVPPYSGFDHIPTYRPLSNLITNKSIPTSIPVR